MTQDEQQRIVRSLESFGEAQAVALGQRLALWAKQTFGQDGKELDLDNPGIHVEFRAAGCDEWQLLKDISFTRFSWETRDDTRRRKEAIDGLFYWQNYESSNLMGDVVEVQYMPYIEVNGERQFKMDELKHFDCTDTGEQREWNQLDFSIYTDPSGSVRGYTLIAPDIQEGDDISWYESWHFSLEDEEPCPVAPIIVEKITPYELVLRYREQLYTLSMAIGKERELALERDVPVKPTHNWDSMWLRPPYTFTLVLRVSWKEELYGSSDRDNFHEKPHYVRTSDLPAGVRTMQQIDHDAWSSQS